jgi:plasmid stabilization system protein ParE
MPGYTLSSLALDDLAGIQHYIAADNPTAARRMIAAFFHRFALIASQPEIGELRTEFLDGSRGLLHGARDFDALL